MAKYTKEIELLVKLVDDKKITINVNSEKTAISDCNKLINCLKDLHKTFIYWIPKGNQPTNWEFTDPNLVTTLFGDYEEIPNVFFHLLNNHVLNIMDDYTKDSLPIREYESLLSSNGISDDIKKDMYPYQAVYINPIDEMTYEYEIKWIPQILTQTTKLNTYNVLKQKQEEVKNVIGTFSSVPNSCKFYGSYETSTEREINNIINNCEEIIKNKIINPSSPKQVYWVAKILNIPENIAMQFNIYQASEILDYSFNKEGYYTTEEQKKVKNFYLNKVNMKNESKIMKLTEKDLHYIITEATKRIVNEWQRSGSIPRDGMTGGSWGSDNVNGIYHINLQDLFELLDEETYESTYEKLESLEDELYFNVSGAYGYDDSVGMSEGYDEITVDYTPAIDAISNLNLFRGDEIAELKNAIMQIADKVENEYGEGVEWN